MVSASSFPTDVFKNVFPFVLFPRCYGGLERSVRRSGAGGGDSAFPAGGTQVCSPADARPIACGGGQNPYPRRSDVVPGMTDLELAQQHRRALSNAVEVALSANPRPVGGPPSGLPPRRLRWRMPNPEKPPIVTLLRRLNLVGI